MRILIVYASNSGNTKMTAERIADTLRRHKHLVVVQDVTETKVSDLEPYDAVVFGSCTWLRQTENGPMESQLPEHMYRFAESLRHKKFPGKPFAVFGLGRHEYTGFCGAANHLQVLVHKLEGSLLLPPLKIDGFPHHQQAITKEWAERLAGQLQAARV